MTRAQRYDTHRLDAVEVLPSGALRVPARLARVGVLTYQDSEGNTWGELVPPETLFNADSMASARGMAVADLHPTQQVTPANRKAVQVGHVGDEVKRDGDYLAAPVYVTDAAEIALVQSGERGDVSCGYSCELDETPGVYDGQSYARVQRNRVYNHLGLGPKGWGRAGTDVSLRLDGAQQVAARFDAPSARLDSQTAHTTGGASRVASDHTGARMKIKIKGREYKLDADAEVAEAQKTVDAMEAESAASMPKKDADEAMAAMEAKHLAKIEALEKLAAEMAKNIAELKAGESAEVAEADVPEAVADSIVSKRLARLDSAREGARLVAPTVKLDGLLKPREIHAAAIGAAMPAMKLDGLSDDGVAGVFVALVEGVKSKTAKRADGGKKAASVLVPDEKQAEEVAREDGASFDPISHQQATVQSWSKRPAVGEKVS